MKMVVYAIVVTHLGPETLRHEVEVSDVQEVRRVNNEMQVCLYTGKTLRTEKPIRFVGEAGLLKKPLASPWAKRYINL